MWKQLRAILLLPVMVTIVIPTYLTLSTGAIAPFALLRVVGGLVLIALGLTLVVVTVQMFIRIGQGTLAPWDETQQLVVVGVYRHVRNPMITGVGLILLGEAVALGSLPILICFFVFAAINMVYIPLSEEAGLERRFGEDYREYKRNVPRWIPRLRAWEAEKSL